MTSESFLESRMGIEEFVNHEPSLTDSVLEWLAPRISFSSSFTGLDIEPPAKREESLNTSPNFEFSMSFSSNDFLSEQFMLTADELFNNGMLLPLPIASHNLASPEQPSLCEHEDAKGLTIVAYQHKDAPCQGSLAYTSNASTAISTPSESCSSYLSHLLRRPPKSSSCWNTLRNLFRLRKDESFGANGDFNRSAVASKFCKFFGRGNPARKTAHTDNLRGGFCQTTSPSDTVRTKYSQTFASLLFMPYQATCCSFPSVNQDKEASIDETVDEHHGGILKSAKNVQEQAKTIKPSPHDSRKSLSLPGTRMSSPERRFKKNDFSQKGFDSIILNNSIIPDTNRVPCTKFRGCKSNQKGLGMRQSQENPSKIQDQLENYQGKVTAYDCKPRSEKVIAYSSGVRVTPILNVPACLTPLLKAMYFTGNVVSIREPFSKKKHKTSFKDLLTAEHGAWHQNFEHQHTNE